MDKQELINITAQIAVSVNFKYPEIEYSSILGSVKDILYIRDGDHYSNVYYKDGKPKHKSLVNLKDNISLKSVAELAISLRTIQTEIDVIKFAAIIAIVCLVDDLLKADLTNEMHDMIIAMYSLRDYSGTVDEWVEAYNKLTIITTKKRMSLNEIPEIIAKLEESKIVEPLETNTWRLRDKFTDCSKLENMMRRLISS